MKVLLVVLIVLVLAVALWRALRRGGRPGHVPPGTAHLDEETAARPDLDAGAVAAARARVSSAVPDEVLSDALLDATPQQLARLFSAVPDDVMAAALGHGAGTAREHVSEADLAQLRGAGDAVDDLEIFNFDSFDPKRSPS